ncbi:uncharacterized protein LOC132272748 [Cornus florida]|uniref:uncharacterized protein LOC132272748 n=1 Tax=Cornus florida TaxID=4283 RepID=UPI00289C8020|nr:uncharacterized protein LOC132272748 [Cornus florida]
MVVAGNADRQGESSLSGLPRWWPSSWDMGETIVGIVINTEQRALFKFRYSRGSNSSTTVEKTRKTPIAVADCLLNRHKFSTETASKVSSFGKDVKRPEETDSILSFLQESGFSDSHLELLIKRMPRVLSANLERTIKPKIKFFQDLGLSSSDFVEIVSSNPWILTTSVDNRLGPSILALTSVLGSNMDVVSRVLKKSGRLLTFDLLDVYVLKPTKIRECVKRVDEMGIDRKSKLFLHAIRAISSMTKENWELKLELFKSLKFSEDDILSVFRRQPQVFVVSDRKIKEITQLFLSTGKCDISYVVNNPDLLCRSVENKLKPRLRVLEVLESRNLLLKKPSLGTVCRITDKKFFEKYVLPYSNEVGELFVVKKASLKAEVCA